MVHFSRHLSNLCECRKRTSSDSPQLTWFVYGAFPKFPTVIALLFIPVVCAPLFFSDFFLKRTHRNDPVPGTPGRGIRPSVAVVRTPRRFGTQHRDDGDGLFFLGFPNRFLDTMLHLSHSRREEELSCSSRLDNYFPLIPFLPGPISVPNNSLRPSRLSLSVSPSMLFSVPWHRSTRANGSGLTGLKNSA